MINLGVPKAAMNQFARYVALELAPHGITANLVAPATVQGTSMNKKLAPEQLSALRGSDSIPLQTGENRDSKRSRRTDDRSH